MVEVEDTVGPGLHPFLPLILRVCEETVKEVVAVTVE
jgi:hypothetical protein